MNMVHVNYEYGSLNYEYGLLSYEYGSCVVYFLCVCLLIIMDNLSIYISNRGKLLTPHI